MTATITFTDGVGAATLSNGKPFPGDRFSNWTPRTIPYGDKSARQSDGAITMFVYRTDYGADFTLEGIPSTTVAGVAQSDIAARLVAWLMQGGQCVVNTGDASSNSYTCGLRDGTTPDLRLTDRQMLEYTLTVSVINLAGSPGPMLCRYADQ